MIRKNSGNLRKIEESRGISTACSNVKVTIPYIQFDDLSFFQNAISEVREISLRSGKVKGKIRKDESRKSGHLVKCSIDRDILHRYFRKAN